MKQIDGFTLIELLFALMILSVLLLIAMPIMTNLTKKQETKKFFDVLEADVFYIQNQALGTSRNLRIVFDKDHYDVLGSGMQNGEEMRRDYPEHLVHDVQIDNMISFYNSGTVANPTTFLFRDGDTIYEVVFPLGKGRHYIEER